jgi:hypothetical protein
MFFLNYISILAIVSLVIYTLYIIKPITYIRKRLVTADTKSFLKKINY